MRPALVTAFALLLAGCASAPPRQPPPPSAPPGAPEVRAVRVFSPPIVDGIAKDVAWAEAPETGVAFGESANLRLLVRSVVHDGNLYLLLEWPDPTETIRRDPHIISGPDYVWREAGIGDNAIVNLPLEGPFTERAAEPQRSTVDFWRWDPRAGAESGHAKDGVLPMRTWAQDGRWYPWALHYGNLEDDEPLSERNAGDVLAQGTWKEGTWTVEFSRALSTGHLNDRDLGCLREVPIRVVVSDTGDKGASGPYDFSEIPILRLLLPPDQGGQR